MLCLAYESSSLKDARIAADSCLMRARSSATVWRDVQWTQLYDDDETHLAGTDALDEGYNSSSMPIRERLGHIRTFQIMINHARSPLSSALLECAFGPAQRAGRFRAAIEPSAQNHSTGRALVTFQQKTHSLNDRIIFAVYQRSTVYCKMFMNLHCRSSS